MQRGTVKDPQSVVFVVDDEDTVRRSLERLLRVSGYTVETFSAAAEFLARPDPGVPCCLVLDIRMPNLTGIDVQRALNDAGRVLPIIFMTGFADVETCVLGMKAGAADFLMKPFDENQLLAAVAAALARSSEIRLAGAERRERERRLLRLTLRERQVFWLVVGGLLNKQIAGELGTKEGTIKLHRANVMRKLEAQSITDLVRLAEQLEGGKANNSHTEARGSTSRARLSAGAL
jgi:FixJ family two-component response regulator